MSLSFDGPYTQVRKTAISKIGSGTISLTLRCCLKSGDEDIASDSLHVYDLRLALIFNDWRVLKNNPALA